MDYKRPRRKRCPRLESSLMPHRSLVSVVDDDESVRESLPDLLRECGFAVQSFASAEECLCSKWVTRTHCLVLDIAMPEVSGPELQQVLKARHQDIPIVFITADRDERGRAARLAQGAVECLFKPFSEADLLRAVHAALGV